MLNRELLIAGAAGGIYGVGQVHEYHGFRLQRANTGNGTIITYKAADGTLKDMLVLDAKYRSVQEFGVYDPIIPELACFSSQNKNGYWYVDGVFKAIPPTEPMRDSVTNDVIYNQWADAFKTDKTAKENCNAWMTYNTQTDTFGVKGVPAVAWCRNQIVDGKQCDLPNEYETIVIFACGDKLDEMDPTAATYSDLRLGYTSTGYNNQGRSQQFNGLKSNWLISSTQYGLYYVRGVSYNGTCYTCNKNQNATAVPILEL